LLHFQETALAIKTTENSNYFDIAPNPFTNETFFRLTKIERQEPLQLYIYNTLGQLVDSIDIDAFAQTVRYENTKLPAGIYYVSLRANGHSIATRSMVIK
jgi:hypothetical protein